MCRLIGAEIVRWQAGEATAAPRPDVVDRYERRRQTAALATVFEQALYRRPATIGSSPHQTRYPASLSNEGLA